MASPSSSTTQSQGGSDTNVTQTVLPGHNVSTKVSGAQTSTATTQMRPDFTISFVFKPSAPPKGTPIQS